MELPTYMPAVRGHGRVASATAGSRSAGVIIAALIWGVVGPAVAVCLLVGATRLAVIVTAAGIIAHSMLRPDVSVYFLAAAIPLEAPLTFAQGFTGPKVIGVGAMIVLLPRLVRAAQGWFQGRGDPMAKWPVLMILLGLLLLPIAPYKAVGLTMVIRFVLVCSMPLLICVVADTRGKLSVLLTMLILGSFVMSLLQILAPGTTEAVARETARSKLEVSAVEGLRDDLGWLTRLAMIAVFSCAYLAITLRGGGRRLLYLLPVPILIGAIVIAKSRSVWVSGPAALLGAILFTRRMGSKRKALVIVLVLVGAVGSAFAVGAMGLFGEGVTERFMSIFEGAEASSFRDVLYVSFLRLSVERVGLGYGVSQARYAPGHAVFGTPSHNDVLEVLADLGVLGLIFFVGMHVGVLRRWRKIALPWDRFFVLLLWMALFTASMFRTAVYDKHYWLVLGVILALIRINENEQRLQIQYGGTLSPFEPNTPR